jgi:hypothetical protein
VLAAYLLWRHGVFGDGVVGTAELAEALSAIAVFLVAAWGLVRKLNRWLVSVSVGAEIRLEHTRPVATAAAHRYQRLVNLVGRPLAVMIDDLDRCQPSFAVELLEGIEQLWGDVPVVYVTAVDGTLLRDAFLETQVAQGGRPNREGARAAAWLRYQSSFDDVIRLRTLNLGMLPDEGGTDGDADPTKLTARFELFNTVEVVLAELAQSAAGKATPVELRRAALMRLETPALQDSLEH